MSFSCPNSLTYAQIDLDCPAQGNRGHPGLRNRRRSHSHTVSAQRIPAAETTSLVEVPSDKC
jgi:hypothetical protein